jgi:hypothetical protein
MNRNIKLLERAYFAILVTIFLLIVFTPYIIRSGFTLFDEEIAEVAAIAFFFTVGYGIFFGRTFRRTHANPWARKEVFI